MRRHLWLLVIGVAGASPAQAQNLDLQLQVGRYMPLRDAMETRTTELGGEESEKHLGSFQFGATLVAWWNGWLGTSLTASVTNPDHVRYEWTPSPEPGQRFERSDTSNFMLRQVGARSVVRVTRVGGFAADASLGVLYSHFESEEWNARPDRSSWGPVLGIDLSQRISDRLSASVSATYMQYDLPVSGTRQSDLALGAGVRLRLRPWIE